MLPREEVGENNENELKLREEETVMQSFPNVRVQIENQSESTSANVIGTLTLTSERVVFQRREGHGDGEDGGEGDNAAEKKKMPSIQIGFKSVCMHAISSCSSSDEKCLYVQVDGKCDPEVGVEEEEGEEDDDDYEPLTEVRFVPVATSEEERKAVVEEMFERMNECALLNPDTEDENDENDDPMMFDGMITAETLLGANGGDDGDGEYFTSEAAIRAAGLGEKLDEFDKKLVISEEDRKRFEDAEEEEEEEEEEE